MGRKISGATGVIKETGESVEVYARRLISPKHPWLIDPRKSKRIGYWDALTSIALIFTASVTPFEVALLQPAFDALFIINRVVDSIFALDIPVQFITMTEKTSQSLTHGVQWVTMPGEIARNYMTSWFALDVLAVGVSAFDVYAVFAQEDTSTALDSGAATLSPEDLSRLTIFKSLRVLRLFKLMRLLRASRMAKRWETRVAIDYSVLSIFKCVVGVLITAHWMACVWLLQAFIAAPTPMPSWLGDDGYCTASTSATSGYTCLPVGSLYMASLYWSVMTLTTVGYGDVAATPFNTSEQAVCAALMCVSAFIYAQVIGTFTGVVANLNPEQAHFRATLHDLNRFMSREGLPNDMCRRLREYVHQSKHLRLAETQRSIMQQMPPSLKGETIWATNQAWLQKIAFLQKSPRAFMVELALSLNAMVFAPGDTPRIGFMYIVHRGVAIYRAKLVTKGRVFGEDMILQSPRLRSNAQAKAMNYLEVYYTSRRELLFIAQRFPRTLAAIRRAAVLLALRRHIIMMARQKIGVAKDDRIAETVGLMRLKDKGGPEGDLARKELAARKRASMKRQGTAILGSAGPDANYLEELPEGIETGVTAPLSPGLGGSESFSGGSPGGSLGGGDSDGERLQMLDGAEGRKEAARRER